MPLLLKIAVFATVLFIFKLSSPKMHADMEINLCAILIKYNLSVQLNK